RLLEGMLLDGAKRLAEMLGAVSEDEAFHDLVRALDDDVDPAVSPDPLEDVLGHVAFAAHDLERFIDGAEADLRSEDLRDRRLEHDVLDAAIDHARGDGEHRVHRVTPGLHVRELRLDLLELADGAAELIAILRPLDRLIARHARCADDARRKAATPVIEAGERDLETFAFLVEQVL